tara:strand:+ start:436 stop:627 length:192 start_codon:yes stop_codon:yes gene_type:complete
MYGNYKIKRTENKLKIKVKEETPVMWAETNRLVSKYIKKGWIVEKDYKDNYTDETIIELKKEK